MTRCPKSGWLIPTVHWSRSDHKAEYCIYPFFGGWKKRNRKEPSVRGKKRKKSCLWMLCNQPDRLQMWLVMGAEGEGPDGRPIPPPCRQISCLFSKRGEDVQINRPHSHDSASQASAVVFPKRRSWISLWDTLRFFSAMLARLPVWVSPHMWHTVGKGLKACLSFSLSAPFLLLKHFHLIPQTVLWWQLTPVRLRFACGIIFVREAAFDCCAGTQLHTMAPLFWSPQVSKLDPEPWGCRGVGQDGRGAAVEG